ncbi:MAG TPA: hypothetical protein VF579_11105, partial [Candidatus Methylomirabilis sp.]
RTLAPCAPGVGWPSPKPLGPAGGVSPGWLASVPALDGRPIDYSKNLTAGLGSSVGSCVAGSTHGMKQCYFLDP